MDHAYVQMRPWSEQDIADVLANPHVHFLTHASGGLIAQVVAGECEILAIATDPAAQRTGVASSLLAELISMATTRNATRILLEVASRNKSARAFYAARGFAQVGARPGYYALRDGTRDDALLLSRALAQGQADDTPTSQGHRIKSG